MQPTHDPHLPWRTKDEIEDDGEPCGIIALVDAQGETVGHLYATIHASRLVAGMNYIDAAAESLSAMIAEAKAGRLSPEALAAAETLVASIKSALAQ